MAKRTVNAKEVVKDIRAGLDDRGLMEKYELSPEWIPILFSRLVESGLLKQSELEQRRRLSEWSSIMDTGDLSELEDPDRVDEFEKTVDLRELERVDSFEDFAQPVSPKKRPEMQREAIPRPKKPAEKPTFAEPEVSTLDLAIDIRAGLDDAELMRKYGLTESRLQTQLDRLVHTGTLKRSELDRRSTLSQPSLLVEPPSVVDPSTTVDLSRFVEKRATGVATVSDIPRPYPTAAEGPHGPAITEETARALVEFAAWWNQQKSGKLFIPQIRPDFKRTKMVTRTVRISENLLKAAEAKAGQERAQTGGDFNSLVELLLWEFLDRDPGFVQ